MRRKQKHERHLCQSVVKMVKREAASKNGGSPAAHSRCRIACQRQLQRVAARVLQQAEEQTVPKHSNAEDADLVQTSTYSPFRAASGTLTGAAGRD